MKSHKEILQEKCAAEKAEIFTGKSHRKNYTAKGIEIS
jgi:hypothetical protein